MKNRILIALAVILLLAGLGVLMYPTFKTAAVREQGRQEIAAFEEYCATATAPAAESTAVEPPDELSESFVPTESVTARRIFPELWEACVAFNEQLPGTQRTTYSAVSLRRPSIKVSDYGWEQEAFGYISIPAAEIEAPLYLGANSANMNKGGAILGQTSMPIGGKSTNCVIAGHRTWSGAIQFKGLENLQVGDEVRLTNPWETLTYHVIETKIVLPDTVDEIMVQEGRDLLTVFTCTYPSTHRYMVICERKIEKGESKPWNWILLPWVASPLR